MRTDTASKSTAPKMYPNSTNLFSDMRAAFSVTAHVEFGGSYHLPADPSVTDKDRVRMTIHDIWKATGYRFT